MVLFPFVDDELTSIHASSSLYFPGDFTGSGVHYPIVDWQIIKGRGWGLTLKQRLGTVYQSPHITFLLFLLSMRGWALKVFWSVSGNWLRFQLVLISVRHWGLEDFNSRATQVPSCVCSSFLLLNSYLMLYFLLSGCEVLLYDAKQALT